MRRPIGLTIMAATLLLAARAASAQSPPAGPPDLGPPMQHLAVQATVKVAPDELVADLAGVGMAPNAAVTQRHVNELMAKAKAIANGAAAMRTSFRDHSVGYTGEKPSPWTAQQSIEIRGRDGEATLDLVGRLQAIGLGITSLEWRVSDERVEQARQNATINALAALRKQATDAAAALGMEVDRIQAVALNDTPWAMPMAAAGMPPPNATAEDQDVAAGAIADVILRAPETQRNLAP